MLSAFLKMLFPGFLDHVMVYRRLETSQAGFDLLLLLNQREASLRQYSESHLVSFTCRLFALSRGVTRSGSRKPANAPVVDDKDQGLACFD